MLTTLAAAAALSISAVRAADGGAESDWSRIYLGSLPTIGGTNGVFAFEWNGHIWTADIKGGTARQLGHSGYEDSWPVMSPDGRKVAFTSNRAGGYGSVFVADIESGAVERLSYDTEAATPRAWSADGKTVLCKRACIPLRRRAPQSLLQGEKRPAARSLPPDRSE